MTEKKPKAVPPLPVLAEEQILENDSRVLLLEAVRPWPVTDWTQHDFGVDAVLSVVHPKSWGKSNHLITGRRIALQLKASRTLPKGATAPIRVRVRSMNFWLASSEPLAIVFCHPASRLLAYRWIDEDVVADLAARDPAWRTRETVTVHIPTGQLLTPDGLERFSREARLVALRRHRTLQPGTYDRLLEEARTVMHDILATAEEAGFASVRAQLLDSKQRVDAATYVVALAGRMRAGKSTLFNALAGREVSPVGRRPTTAVPIMVASGATDSATVQFLDNKSERVPAKAESLALYATQKENPDNEKSVRLIAVKLSSRELERGFALLDAPGLFDPSPHTREITARALSGANAVLFLMDVSSARDGGFAIDHYVLEELRGVADHSEHVFVVLNKADGLTDEDRDDALATLADALQRADLHERVAQPPILISARDAWKWRAGGQSGESPLSALDQRLWEYLLATNSTGVARLESAVAASRDAVSASTRLLAMRQADSAEALRASDRLRDGTRSIEALHAWFAKERVMAGQEIAEALSEDLRWIPEAMATRYRAAGSIPNPREIREILHAEVNHRFGEAWDRAERRLQQHGHELNTRLEAALQQVRIEHDPLEQPHIPAPQFNVPRLGALPPEAFGFGALGGLVTSAFLPGYGIWGALASFVLGHFLGRDDQLERDISRLEERIRAHVDEQLPSAVAELVLGFEKAYSRMERRVKDRWSVFTEDVNAQLAASESPLTPEEEKRLERLQSELASAAEKLDAVAEQIRWTPNP